MPKLYSVRFCECARDIFALFEPLFTRSTEAPCLAATYVFNKLKPASYSWKLIYEVKQYLGIKSMVAHKGHIANLVHGFRSLSIDEHVIIRTTHRGGKSAFPMLRNESGKHFYVWYLPESQVLSKPGMDPKKRFRRFSESDLRDRLKKLEELKQIKSIGPYKKTAAPREALAMAMRKLGYDAPATEVLKTAKIVLIGHREIGRLSLLRAKKSLGIESVKRGRGNDQHWRWIWGAPEIVDWLLNSVGNSPIPVEMILNSNELYSADVIQAARRKTNICITFVEGKQCWYRSTEEDAEIEQEEQVRLTNPRDLSATHPTNQKLEEMRKNRKKAGKVIRNMREIRKSRRAEVKQRGKRDLRLADKPVTLSSSISSPDAKATRMSRETAAKFEKLENLNNSNSKEEPELLW
jgi:hypothetical protein